MSNIKTASRLNIFKEYIFSSLGKEVAKVEQTGRKVLSFGSGNPDFPTNKIYLEKYCEEIKKANAYLYPGFGANPKFSQSLINWYKLRFNVSLEKDELLPLLGAKDGVSHLPLALLNEGDEVLVPDPGYPAFTDPALMVGAVTVYYDLNEQNNFQISLTQLENRVTKKTKFIWVNFPSNPTGATVTLEELKKIVEFAKKHKLMVVYDNAYSEISFDDFTAPSILQIKGAKDFCVELGSFSKTFSFAGFRMGWIVGNKQIIAALAKVKSQMDSGLSTPLQNLGAYVLDNFDKNWHKEMIASYKSRRDTIAEYLRKLGLEFDLPKAGLYIWAKIPPAEKSSEQFVMKLLRTKQILLTPGTAFGKNGEGFVRVSFCVNIDKIDKYF